jgi:PAS domain-containing protein
MQFAFDPEEVVQAASAAVASRTGPASNFLDDLPGALYVTDTEGVITHFNKACIGFAGRVPVINRDRWCVTWRLFREDDSFLPHDAPWRLQSSSAAPSEAQPPSREGPTAPV